MLLVAYRAVSRLPWVAGGKPLARAASWMVMFHLTCYGWLIFRAQSATHVGQLTLSLAADFQPASMDVAGLLVPLLLHVTPFIVVHAAEAWHNDLLVVPRLSPGVRYSAYAATCYLTLLFGNFGGAEFIYFQF